MNHTRSRHGRSFLAWLSERVAPGFRLDKQWSSALKAPTAPPLERLIYRHLQQIREQPSPQPSPPAPVALETSSSWSQIANARRPSNCALATRVLLPENVCLWLARWSRTLSKTILLCDEGRYFSSDNSVRFFDDNEACLTEMLTRMNLAEKRIWLETYCLGENQTQILSALHKAVSRGVDVVISVDSIGSLGIPRHLSSLHRAGVRIVYFNPWWRLIGPLVYRNHRKTLVCDNTAFVGSLNLDARALPSNQSQNVSRRWLPSLFSRRRPMRPPDYNHQLEVQGPAVSHLCDSFLRVLRDTRLPLRPRSANPVSVEEEHPLPPGPDTIDKACVQVLESDGRPGGRSTIPRLLLSCLVTASQSIVVGSSYFHPPGFLRRALGHSARRGVPTTLLLSGLSDVPFDSRATLAVLPYFLMGARNRLRAFFVNRYHCHLKTFTADGIVSVIGSYNWDRSGARNSVRIQRPTFRYSSRRNREVCVAVLDPRVTKVVNQRIDAQLATGDKLREGTVEYTLADAGSVSLLHRARDLLCYHIVRATGGSFWDGFQKKKNRARETGQFRGETG
eukprot:Gregarina_sp_Poly_1__7646@NODE_42_length_18083_cov_98_634880_g36_i0_p3_GENE_NODE_42_length_18083_cov_98_634880_g36_i0NODE_42_length_18083_cov_98_634880_g36_i0_p3_ORF_typecomplete_len563_score65_98PLDc_2/PF13091_6/1_9e15PLDc_2/PF13091_6/1_5e10PLDc/PF00614_22/0_00066PLDc/PF00614_22/32Regulator_TrmB/PF11495_8/0_0068Regulator_TrmB/PF11495_8/6_NODE_42_length_18083_cov_98_634880_g36_i01025711945